MAYLLSKILPLLLLPLGLSLILLVLGLVGRWRWPVITAALLLWVFSLGMVSQSLWRWLEPPGSAAPPWKRPKPMPSSCSAVAAIPRLARRG